MNIITNKHIIKHIIYYFALLILIQLFVLDKINTFYGYIVPSVYFYILLWIPISVSTTWLLIIAFLLGYIMDILHLSMGIHTFACVNVAFFRNIVYKNLISTNYKESITEINIPVLGFPKYLLYLLIMTAIYFISMTMLEWFSLNIWQYYFIVKCISDTCISIFLIILIDFITLRFRKKAYF